MNRIIKIRDFLKNRHRLLLFIGIPLLSFSMHYRIFGLDIMGIHSWRQTVTQSNIVNFYEEDNNILDPRLNERYQWKGIYRMEFPVMQWLFAQVYRVFGNDILISRILSFLIGLIAVWGIYFLVLQLFRNKLLSVLTAWAFNFSPLFYYYTMNPLPDNFALCFAIWGAAYSFKYIRENKLQSLLLASLFISMGTLAKLPFGLFYAILGFYFIQTILRKKLKSIGKEFGHGLISLLLLSPAIAWYAWVIPKWQNGITKGVLSGKDTAFVQIWDYLSHHLFSTFPELMLNYLALPFFIWAIWLIFKNKVFKKSIFTLLAIWSLSILFYFFFEINMITRVHDYYLFPFLPLIFIIAAYGIKDLITSQSRMKIVMALILLMLLPLSAFLRIDKRWNPDYPGFNKDLLIYTDELREAVPDSCLVVVGNDASPSIWLYYVNKKGWVYRHNKLSGEKLFEIRKFGGKYMYSDSRLIDEDSLISSQFKRMVMEKGSIRVFELKQWPD
ncbi:MAG: glycosyltransferase family 39 protein [Bacteroidetes bacterium]|nr:glycosyltransferase family 39 protein [Bacteroidota bacterium]MBL6962258.1 glycosyltransferase family 39 protein [Bacteroidota bacterium]